jgi:replicative DNA helicase
MKTSVLVDIGISLGTGLPFLTTFEICQSRRVAVLSGESGGFTLKETALRVAASKGISLSMANCLWSFELPQLTNAADVGELQRGLKENGVEVMLFDPLYLALLAGSVNGGSEASNLYAMGPLLLSVSKACTSIGVTPVLVHHTRMHATGRDGNSDIFKPIDLEALAYAGVQEFARQWILINRREVFQPGSGIHKLWLSVGGSTGQSGLWCVDVNEGILDEDFGGRKWELTVTNAGTAIQALSQAKEEKKSQAAGAKEKRDDAALLNALDRLDATGAGASKTTVREIAKLNSGAMTRACDRLIKAGTIEFVPGFKVKIGSNAERDAIGIRRKMPGTDRPV